MIKNIIKQWNKDVKYLFIFQKLPKSGVILATAQILKETHNTF